MASKSKELQELISSLQNSNNTPKTAEQLQQQAQNRYQSYYDAQRLSAQQEYDRNVAALEKQLAGLDMTYEKQREQSEKAYEQAVSKADRNLLSKGMQRSSYGAQTLANIQTAGNEALQDIADQEALQRQGIRDNQTLLAQQLAAQLAQYDTQQAADVLAYLDELEAKEYDREQAALQYNNQLKAQIYEYIMQEKQYNDSKKKSSSSSSKSSSSSTTNTTTNTGAGAMPMTDAELLAQLNQLIGGGTKPAVPSTPAPVAPGPALAVNDAANRMLHQGDKRLSKTDVRTY